jgi:hypothetical protein
MWLASHHTDINKTHKDKKKIKSYVKAMISSKFSATIVVRPNPKT